MKNPKATVPKNSFLTMKKSNVKVDVPESIASIILYYILLNVIMNTQFIVCFIIIFNFIIYQNYNFMYLNL
jgi:hypothetical protein